MYKKISAAILNNDIEKVKQLIKSKANVNYAPYSNTTLLWNACTSENIEMVRLLLEAGADPNIMVKGVPSCLSIATEMDGRTEFVQLLLEYKASVKKDLNHGHGHSIYVAECCGYDNILELLQNNLESDNIYINQ